MIKIAICDDEISSLNYLHNEVVNIAKEINCPVETFLYQDSKIATKVIVNEEEYIDIILL